MARHRASNHSYTLLAFASGLLILVLILASGCTSILPAYPTPYAVETPSMATAAPTAVASAEQPTTAPAARATSTLTMGRATGSASATQATPLPTVNAGAKLPAGLAIPTPLASERVETIHYAQLPPQAHDTLALIARGGPYPYKQDGVVFENREKLLPAKPSGYYHEYTVVTPGSPDRGARRIIRGGQGELYYTVDHYASFKRVIP